MKEKLLLLVISAVLSLAALEAYVRLTSPHIIRKDTKGPSGIDVPGDDSRILSGEYGFFIDTLTGGRRLIPNTHVVRVKGKRRIPIDINSSGFRDLEIPAAKGPEERRILFLGDSVTIGVDVLHEHTFSNRAEQFLRKLAPSKQVRCINGGVEGIGMKDEIDILVDQGLAVHPDIVVVDFFLNDGNPPDRLAVGLANPGFLRRHSVLAQTIYRAYKFQQYRRGEIEEARVYEWALTPPPHDMKSNRTSFFDYAKLAEKDWGAAWNPGTWTGIEQQMDRLSSLAKQHNLTIAVAAFPVSYQVYADYVEDEPQQRLKTLARKYHFEFLDLLPIFRAHPVEDLFVDHYHLNENGHDRAGKALAAWLQEKL